MLERPPILALFTSLLALAVGSGLGACDSSAPPGDSGESEGDTGEFELLIDHTAWIPIADAIADPLADHRPAEVECGIAGWYLEGEELEIDTTFCNYLALRQPTLAAIEQGKGVRLDLYHFNLTAPEPVVAHVAILVDGEPLWEQEIAVPGEAKVYRLEFESPLSAPAGAELVFHLHNHGQNTWALETISAEQ